MSTPSSTAWTEVRLIGAPDHLDDVVRLLSEAGAEIRQDTGNQTPRKGKDGKSRRYLHARLPQARQERSETEISNA